jgi:hypothetical protein
VLAWRLTVSCVVLLAVLAHARPVNAGTLTLAWDHSPDNVAGYLVSYGTQSGQHTTNIKTGYVTSISLTGLADGTIYYFILRSYDQYGYVGQPTPEVVAATPSPQPVAIFCPSPVLTSPDGKPMSVTLSPTVTAGVQPITTTCSPTSGSLFPVGSTTFTCSATDALQSKASCASTVVVLAQAAPTPAPNPPAPSLVLRCPAIPSVTANGNSGKTIVKFADPVWVGGTAPVVVSCAPASGSQFSVGTTAVSCQAKDAARRTAACTTSVTVVEPAPKEPKTPKEPKAPAPKDPK